MEDSAPIFTVKELVELRNLCFPLLLIERLGRATGETELARISRVSCPTARRWLVELARLGYLVRRNAHNGYWLSPEAEARFRKDFSRIHPILSLSIPTTTTTYTESQADQSEEESAVESLKRKKIALSSDPLTRAVVSALGACGIGEPKRSELASQPWMTVELIERWKANLRQRGKLSAALLIHCLQDGLEPPVEEDEEDDFEED